MKNLTAPDLARALEDAGVAAIFIHGRTREQGFGGTVNLAGIRAVVQAVKNIPVIGNGDIITPPAAKKMFDETGCAGVSIGRGAFYNPWIFQHTLHYLKTSGAGRAGSPLPPLIQMRTTARTECRALPQPTAKLLPEPTFADRVRVMCRHLDLMIEVFGEEPGCRMFRKIAPWHAKRFGPLPRIQQTRRAGLHPGRIPRTFWKITSAGGNNFSMRTANCSRASARLAGRVLHARSGFDST